MGKRGRPRKFSGPSRLVAMTLPDDVIATLRSRDRDLAKAVVAIVGEANGGRRKPTATRRRVADLVEIAPRRFLITVNRRIIKHLPGCELVAITPETAFVVIEPGRGFADVVLSVIERLEEPGIEPRERDALRELLAALRVYGRDKKLNCEIRSILVLRSALSTPLLRSLMCYLPLGCWSLLSEFSEISLRIPVCG